MKKRDPKEDEREIRDFLNRLDRKEIKAVLGEANKWREIINLPPFKTIKEMIDSECSIHRNRHIRPVDIFHIRYREVILIPIFNKIKNAGIPMEGAIMNDKEIREAMKIIELKTGVREKIKRYVKKKRYGY